MSEWIITAYVETQNEVLYWNNQTGWTTEIDEATKFKEQEKNVVRLPIGGKWVEYKVKLTAKEKANYLSSDAGYCPYCHSSKLDASPLEVELSQAWSDVKCFSCGRCWTDVYTLTDIEEEED